MFKLRDYCFLRSNVFLIGAAVGATAFAGGGVVIAGDAFLNGVLFLSVSKPCVGTGVAGSSVRLDLSLFIASVALISEAFFPPVAALRFSTLALFGVGAVCG